MVRSLTVVTTLVLGSLAPLGQVLAWSYQVHTTVLAGRPEVVIE